MAHGEQPNLGTRRTIAGVWLVTTVSWFIAEVLWCWRFASGRGFHPSSELTALCVFCVLGIIWCLAGLFLLICWRAGQKKAATILAAAESF